MTNKNLKDFMVDGEHYINHKGEKVKIKKHKDNSKADIKKNISLTNNKKRYKALQNKRYHNGSKDLEPWKNPNGKWKTVSELKRSSRNWSATVWERYLKNIEKRSEELLPLDPLAPENIAQEDYENLFRKNARLDNFTELKKIFITALKNLTRKQAMVLKLRFIDNLTVGEISSTLGVNARTVRTNLCRSLKKLEKIMDSKHVIKLRKIHSQEILVPLSRK